ncbi:MAG: hypothetical protein M1834_008325 [Cirrosporium novae-zelandiae]|nr:MAG: hypothetical protein M1834_008325 [Cirrosporium novae-zelandiae]
MSGAEALAVISIISNIIGLVDFGGDIKQLPAAFRDFQNTLPLLAQVLSRTKGQVESHQINEASCKALFPVVKDCQDKVAELDAIFKKIIPSATKAIFLVPYARNLQFIGRGAYIKDLDTKLENGKEHHRVALVGLGGIDKSQIALEYAYRYHEKLPDTSVYWVHASNAQRFEQDYRQIGINARLPRVNDPDEEIKQLVKNWLSSEESGIWLMIVDNADDADTFFGSRKTTDPSGSSHLSNFLPQCPNGSIIFATRNKKAGVKFATASGIILLPKMGSVDAQDLLKARVGENISNQDNIIELLELLEYLPLAISQAGSYIAENSIPIDGYLQMYKESETCKIELLSQDFEDLARDSEAKNPIAAIWEISFNRIRESDVLAANLLSIMACLDRQGIPKAVLRSTETLVKFSNALGLLKAYSLITASQDGMAFNIHQLVHLTTRNWLRLNNNFKYWVIRNLILMSNEFPSGEHETLNTCDLYLPHPQAVLSHEQSLTANDLSRASLAYRVSRYFLIRGLYDSAKTPARQAVLWRDRALGSEDRSTLTSKDNLASVLYRQGKYEEAETMHRQVLELREEILGKKHPDTLTSINNLAVVLNNQGKYDEAEKMHRRILELREKILGKNHPDTLGSISYLACTLHNQKQYDNASLLYRRACSGYQTTLGSDHPTTLKCLEDYSSMLKDMEQPNLLVQTGNIEASEGWQSINT